MRRSTAEFQRNKLRAIHEFGLVCNICGDSLERTLLENPEIRHREAEFRRNGTGYWEVDHVLPVSKGGADSIENLQMLCRKCHLKKTGFDRSNMEFITVIDRKNRTLEVFWRIYSPKDAGIEIYRRGDATGCALFR